MFASHEQADEEDRAVKRADTRPQAPGPVPARRRASRRARALLGAGLAVLLAAAVTGCSAMSPVTTITPYAPSDGVNVDLSDDVRLRNFLVIGAEKDGPGAVVGAVVNNGDRTVTVELAAQLGETAQPSQTRVSVPPGGQILIAPGQRYEMVIEQLPAGPGEVLEMSAAAASAGATFFEAPVLAPEGEYASLTVAPTTPAATPTSTPSVTVSPSESVTEEPTAEPTE
jgi:hypothetical protein